MKYEFNMCCDMMDEKIEAGIVWMKSVDDSIPYTFICDDIGDPATDIDYCPWCGKKLSFKKIRDEWDD